MQGLVLLSLLVLPRQDIVDGVRMIAAPGSPGNVVVWGDGGLSVAADRDGRTVVGAVDGPGRIVALSHNGMLSAFDVADTGRLFANSVRWAGGGNPTKVTSSHAGLGAYLKAQGLPAQSGWSDWAGGKGEVAVVDAHQVKPSDVVPLQEFVRRGGGLIIAATGWGWQQGSQKPMSEFEANRALRPFGIGFGDGFAEKDRGGLFDVSRLPGAESHAGVAMATLNSGQGNAALAGRTAVDLLRVLATTDPWIVSRVKDLGAGPSVAIRPEKPVGQNQAKERFMVAYQWQQIERGELLGAAPSAAVFPGAVPAEAKPVKATVTLRAGESRWLSTGLYAVPGQAVRFDGLPAGSTLRVGGHTDSLWHLEKWQRFPAVSLSWPAKPGTLNAMSPFGGLIYVDLPKPLSAPTNLEVDGAVRAPRFVLGEMNFADWRRQLRNNLGPWAEIESKHMVVTVPRSAVEGLMDPTLVAQFWDKVAEATADLAQMPRWRGFKERFMADQQISAGYMHSGYPIMTWLDVIGHVTDAERLYKEGSWGHFHEIGHNHQNGDWTFDGTGEVTVNLFTLYSYDTVVGKRPADRAFTPADCMKRFNEYLKNGKSFEKWKSDPFLALAMYAQLQNEFGWDTFKRVFKRYHALPRNQRPKNDAEKRDLWMTMFSGEVKQNLGPFFQAWGVPTSEESKVSIANFPIWMPTGMEMP